MRDREIRLIHRRRLLPRRMLAALAALLTVAFAAASARAAIVTVDTNTDVSDGDVSSITNLLGNRGADGRISLREAMLAANNTPNVGGPDQIRFAIGSGLVTITPNTPLPLMSNPVVMDATTQPGYTGNPLIQLDGRLATGSTAGIDLVTDSSTVRGFIVHSWDDEGLEVDG